MTTICLYFAVTPVATVAFGQVARAHSHLSSASFVASYKVTGLAQSASMKYEVKYRWPSQLRIKNLDPATGKPIRDRVIESGRIVDYDPALQQYTVADRQTSEPLGKTLAALDRDLDDVILAYTAPEGFEVWSADLLKLSPWKFAGARGGYSLTYASGQKRIVVEVDRASSLLRRVDIKTGPDRLVWDIKYNPNVTGVAFTPPKGAHEFPVFDREFRPPKYASAEAERVANRMFDAYSGLRSFGFDVVRDSGTTRVQIAGRFVRQDDPVATWSYDGKTLTYHDKRTGQWYSGKLSFPDVVDRIGDLGTRVDPTARLLMSGYNPYLKRLGDGAVVKVAGTMPLDGRESTILECETDNALVTLFVRGDGLVASSSTRTKVEGANEEGETNLRYSYFNVPQNAASRLRLLVPAGEKPLSLTPVSN